MGYLSPHYNACANRHHDVVEIRDFPKSLLAHQYDELADVCLRGIANATNLRSCKWTRDGSMSSEVLQILLRSKGLEELEINGHHDPSILKRFESLRKISLIMPSPSVIDVLPRWIRGLRNDLRSLNIICKVALLIFFPMKGLIFRGSVVNAGDRRFV